MSWREDKIGVTGDISKMFNQIQLYPEDQRYHRFLWRDGDERVEPDVYQWLRVSFGDKSSPDLAGYCIKLLANVNQELPMAYDILTNKIYVDDISFSEDTPEYAKETVAQIDEVLDQGSFKIKAWHSNHPEVDQAPDDRVIDILGHSWDKSQDDIGIKEKELDDFSVVTKRTVLGLVSKLWDPTGILAPVTMKYRIALQRLWEEGYAWDTNLPEDKADEWRQYLLEMKPMFKYRIKRCSRPEDAVGKPQLHGFADGGDSGYGACCFLRWKLKTGHYQNTFIAAKALVAPLRKKSIPRLELMGCVVMSRLVKTIEDALKIEFEQKYLWVDSTTVLKWIRSPARKYKAFVCAKVSEIQENHAVDVFRYVPSKCNPADELTKPIPLGKLEEWHQGPSMILHNEEDWPKEPENIQSTDKEDPELKTEKRRTPKKHVKINTATGNEVDEEEVDPDPDSELDNVESRVKQAIESSKTWLEALKKAVYIRREEQQEEVPITTEEYDTAENDVFRLCQKGIDFSSKAYRKLDPSYESKSGLVRVNGRLNKAEFIPQHVKNPIILPAKSLVNELIAKHYHEKCFHSGYRRVKAEIQSRGLWICGIKDLLRSVAARCMYCRERRGKLLTQKMGELPDFRAEPGVKPFQNCAMDFFGPLKVKYGGRSVIEGHVLIITCTVTRAIHLELCTDNTSETFLLAWRRFVCSKGVYAKKLWSDNGGNFVGAQAYLKEVVQNWNEQKIREELAKDNVDFEWKFNCPTASHMNGVVESLIKSVRKALDATCGIHETSYTYEEWNTFLQEVSYLINSRPLFPRGEDPLEYPSVTPNSLLHGHGIEVPQPKKEERVNPRDRMRSVQQRVQTFWERWMLYMPPQLLERNKWFHSRDNLQVGDMVLLMKPGLNGTTAPRASWERAVVVETYQGSDGLVRKVKVKTSKGEYQRPVHKMCLIATKDELNQNEA